MCVISLLRNRFSATASLASLLGQTVWHHESKAGCTGHHGDLQVLSWCYPASKYDSTTNSEHVYIVA